MRFPIDAIFLARDNTVLRIFHSMRPNRVSPMVRGAHAVLELPAGTALSSGTEIGDTLEISPS